MIGERRIGGGEPVFIIAEAGVNHNGSREKAFELIRAAKECGADAVKFQTFAADRVASKGAPKAEYQLRNTDQSESQIAMLKKLELSREDHEFLIRECSRLGITFLSTPYSQQDIALLDSIGVPAFKVASALAVELPFLRQLAERKKPILLSTGMCNMREIERSIEVLEQSECEEYLLFQCTTNYPTAADEVNLRVLNTYQDRFSCPIGFSDHSEGLGASTLSVAFGVSMIERHFTLDRSLPGPDHSSSSDPEEFAALVRAVREAEELLGSGEKALTPSERENLKGMRRGLVAARDLPSGTILTIDDIAFKRPLGEFSPNDLDRIIGGTLRHGCQADSPITKEMLSE